MDDIADRLRSSGKRLTAQRQLILRAIEELGHATPDQVLAAVHEHSDAINISTVYRNLEVLEELGLVRHTHLSDRAPTYHSVTDEEHFHLVCRNCQQVFSVDPDVVAPVVARLRDDFAFVPDVGHLTVFGQCVDCTRSTTVSSPEE